jgi:hypothetical protein
VSILKRQVSSQVLVACDSNFRFPDDPSDSSRWI